MCARGSALSADAPQAARVALSRMGPMKASEWKMATISIVLLAAWILSSTLQLDPTASALIAVAALLVTGVIGWNDVAQHQEAWNSFIWFATLVMMAGFLGQLGLIKWFTGQVAG